MPRDSRRAFLEALEKVSPQLRRAFEQAIQDIRSTAQLRAIEAAIDRGDIEAAIQAIRLGGEFFAPLDDAIVSAFRQGAIYQLSTLPKKTLPDTGPLLVRFQGRHPRAERWTRQRAAELITEITEDQRRMIRETIHEGISQNRGTRNIVLDLIGRTEGNQRVGGLIGLHSKQAEAVRAARADLSGGDINRYMRRQRRDRRFDRTILKAQREGRALTAKELDKITGRYAERLLRLRGENIARTESNRAMNEGKAEAIRQMIDSGQITEDMVTKIWDATPGLRTRDSHRLLNGVHERFGQSFVSPVSGALMDHPHDASHGAPASELVNCRCSVRYRIDWAALAR
jgi:hypothetical protein